MLGETMDLLFYGHPGSASELGPDSPINLHFTRNHTRDSSSDSSQSSDDDSSDGMNPESSTMAAKRALLSKTRTTKNSIRNNETLRRSVMVDSDEQGSDSNHFYNTGVNPASTEIQDLRSNNPPTPSEQSYPTADLNSRILWSGQQTGRGTYMKKVSRLRTWTAVISNGKRDRGAMTDAGEPNSPGNTAESQRKILHTLPTEDPSTL